MLLGHRHPARQDPPYPLEHAFMTGTLTPMPISVPPAYQEQEESCVAFAISEQGPLLLYRLSYWTSIRGEWAWPDFIIPGALANDCVLFIHALPSEAFISTTC
jgi:hypothetical protein